MKVETIIRKVKAMGYDCFINNLGDLETGAYIDSTKRTNNKKGIIGGKLAKAIEDYVNRK